MHPHIFRAILTACIFLTSLTGCAKFKEGNCIQNPEDGYVWRITSVKRGKYMLQNWVDGKWGLSVDGPFSIFDSRYIKISCPFTTEAIPRGNE